MESHLPVGSTTNPNPYAAPTSGGGSFVDDDRTYEETAELTPAVMNLAVKVHSGRSFFLGKAIFISGGLIMLGLAGLVVLSGAGPIDWFTLVLAILGSYLLGLGLFTGVLVDRRTRRALMQSGGLRQTISYTIGPDWFGVSTDDSETRIRWSALYQWKEGHGLILIYRTAMYYQVVPVDQFGHEGAQALQWRLKQHVG